MFLNIIENLYQALKNFVCNITNTIICKSISEKSLIQSIITLYIHVIKGSIIPAESSKTIIITILCNNLLSIISFIILIHIFILFISLIPFTLFHVIFLKNTSIIQKFFIRTFFYNLSILQSYYFICEFSQSYSMSYYNHCLIF